MLLVFSNERGFSDPFYLRFTSDKQKGLILGTSKSAQGLMPSVINRKLKEYYEYPIYNYSFTLSSSPFGKVYYESIKRKLNIEPEGPSGIFIITVDPWSVSIDSDTPDDESVFPENDKFLAGLENVSYSPNFEYLFEYYPHPYYRIIWQLFRPGPLRLHPDGWLEVSVAMDSTSVAKRSVAKLKQYYEGHKKSRFSNERFLYLTKTIKLLQKHGDVFLVRLPVGPEMLRMESSMMQDFDMKISSLADQNSLPYFDMTRMHSTYAFVDGNHLHKSSSRTVSEQVSQFIIETKERSSRQRDGVNVLK